MLGLPLSTDTRKAIPKPAFFSSQGFKGAERERFDREIHSLTIRSIVNPESINLPRGKEVGSIYVMEVQLNIQDFDERDLHMLDKLGHKTIYVMEYGNIARIAIVEESVFMTDWKPLSELEIVLEGLDLDACWTNLVRSIGELPHDLPLSESIPLYLRLRELDRQLKILDKRIAKEKQNHIRRELHAQSLLLRKEFEDVKNRLNPNGPI